MNQDEGTPHQQPQGWRQTALTPWCRCRPVTRGGAQIIGRACARPTQLGPPESTHRRLCCRLSGDPGSLTSTGHQPASGSQCTSSPGTGPGDAGTRNPDGSWPPGPSLSKTTNFRVSSREKGSIYLHMEIQEGRVKSSHVLLGRLHELNSKLSQTPWQTKHNQPFH